MRGEGMSRSGTLGRSGLPVRSITIDRPGPGGGWDGGPGGSDGGAVGAASLELSGSMVRSSGMVGRPRRRTGLAALRLLQRLVPAGEMQGVAMGLAGGAGWPAGLSGAAAPAGVAAAAGLRCRWPAKNRGAANCWSADMLVV